MNWWSIRIDPLPLPQRLIAPGRDDAVSGAPSYQLWLPLIPDGRIFLPLFHAEPGRARIISLDRDGDHRGGQIELRDQQWFCAWPPRAGQDAGDLRIIGTRFMPGEVIGLRPPKGVIELYRVSDRAVHAA